MYESDETLYERFLREKDNEALDVLVERYSTGLTLFLRGFVGSMEDAEDLMMDSFVAIATKRSWSARGSSFKTWLFAIGRKLALMHLRKSKKIRHYGDGFDAEPEDTGVYTDDAAQHPEIQFLKKEQNLKLYRAMEKLQPQYKEVLFLLYFEQMSYEEVEKVMGKSKKQLYRLCDHGKAALRSELERMGFDYDLY